MRSTFLSALLWCYIFGSFVAKTTLGVQQSMEPPAFGNRTSASNLKRPSKQPSSVISDNESDGLAKLLNGFVNLFSDKSRPVGTLYDSSSPFVPNCETGIAQLENSVWFILNRVWLATSCQYSDQELDNAIDQVENEGRKMLVTLQNTQQPKTTQVSDFNSNDRLQENIRATLKQAIAKMRSIQAVSHCHFSSIKELVRNFEAAIRENCSHKEAIAPLQQDTNKALLTIKSKMDEIYKMLQDIVLRKEENVKALEEEPPQESESLGTPLLSLHVSKNETTEASATKTEKITNQGDSKVLNPMVAPAGDLNTTTLDQITEANSTLTPLESYLSFGMAGLSGRLVNLENELYRGEYLYLARNPNGRWANILRDAATLAATEERLQESAWLWEFVPILGNQSACFYPLNKLNKHKPMPSKENPLASDDFISVEIATGGASSSELVIYLKNTANDYYYYPHYDGSQEGRGLGEISSKIREYGTKWIVKFVSFNETLANPVTDLQSKYTTLGFAADVFKRLVTIENEYYRGEFLYLRRNPTNRNASVVHDGATLKVGEERLGENPWLWEFVPVPEEDSSTFYLRNKLNQHKPMASKQDRPGQFNYISVENASPPNAGHPTQIVIYMKSISNDYYYAAGSIPNNDLEEENGRQIYWSSSGWYGSGTKWIVHFVS